MRRPSLSRCLRLTAFFFFSLSLLGLGGAIVKTLWEGVEGEGGTALLDYEKKRLEANHNKELLLHRPNSDTNEDAFGKEGLPAGSVDALPPVIGGIKTAEPSKPVLYEELERSTGKVFWTKPKNEAKTTESGTAPNFVFTVPTPEVVREGALAFPPPGREGPSLAGSIYYPLQQRFVQVEVKTVVTDTGLVLLGSALCEEERGEDVVLLPCIFRDIFPYGHGRSPLEQDLARTVQQSQELEYYPWARYATSYLGCGVAGHYRLSVQFGGERSEQFISLRVPYSFDTVDALKDLEKKREEPCSGLDVFFSPESAIRLLEVVNNFRQIQKGGEDGVASDRSVR